MSADWLQGPGKPIQILLVEDNPGDVRLTQEALKGSKISNSLHVVNDGVEAMLYLRKQGQFSENSRPDLILLDLNLPKKDGRETLEEIKNDPDLKQIPVVILTSSSAEMDVAYTYSHYANCFIVKPVDFTQFIEVIRKIEDFWLTIVKLPNK